MAGWQKGQSGNPHGRPPTARSLTNRLLDELERKYAGPDGKSVEGKALLAQMRVRAALTGKLTLADGTERELTTGDLLALQEWVYRQIDGPPKAELDVTSDGAAITFQFCERAAGGIAPDADAVSAK